MLIKQNRGKQWLDWQRRIIAGAHYVGLGACLLLLAALCFGEMGLPRYFDMRDHARQLETEILDLQRGVMGLHSDIDRLEHDPLKIEQLAREQLGYVRKGETVYQLLPETSQDRLRP
jgi:cell division protein FtsB